MPITIKFCGGVGRVTGSMHLLATEKARILIDVGLFQGRRNEFYAVNSDFPFNPSNLDSCIISHAHIDHCGNLPTLVKKGFRSKVYLTPTTRDLCRFMLPDSGYVQEEDIKYVNKIKVMLSKRIFEKTFEKNHDARFKIQAPEGIYLIKFVSGKDRAIFKVNN